MKKKRFLIFSLIMSLFILPGLLAGCSGGKDDVSITGIWNNDASETSAEFKEDGTASFTDFGGVTVEGPYEWDGEKLSVKTDDSELVGSLNEEGGLVIEGMSGSFSRAEEAHYVFREIAGTAWDDHEGENSFIFNEDGTGAQTDAWISIDFTYTWDGEKLVVSTDWIAIEGALDEDGNLVLDGKTLEKTETPTYSPGMYSGGMEAELEGDWIHSGGYILLSFDGTDSVAFQRSDAQPGEVSSGGGTYTYDGETLTITIMDGDGEIVDYEGYLDGDGDIIISMWGEDGYYTPGDGSSLTYPMSESEVSEEAAADLVGEWRNSISEDVIWFSSDGSAQYSFAMSVGYVYPYEYDGYNVSFGDYTGYIDEDGDLFVSGIDDYFIRVNTTDNADSSAEEEIDYGWEITYSSDGEEGISPLDGKSFDNDTEELSLLFEDGAYGLFSYGEWIDEGYYRLDDGEITMNNGDEIKTGVWDPDDNTITIDGLDGYFHMVDTAAYYEL